MNTCYVIAREGVSGGTGTLSYRLLNYLHNHNNFCAYLCCENNAPQTFSLIENVVNDLEIDNDLTYRSQFERICNKYDSFVFLTYSIEEFLAIDRLRRKYVSITNSILYVVHGYAFTYPPEIKLPYFKNILVRAYIKAKFRRLVKSLLESHSILFMDVLSVQETEKSLNVAIEKTLIHFLPIAINQYSESYWKSIRRNDPFTIGTMCRMEFPFKGYVLGLLEQFADLCKKYNLRLLIVGDGVNGDEVRNKLNCLPADVQNRILYKLSIDYSELESFYSQCDVAIGMGTMLLDAANYNVLSIPVKGYTRELSIGHLFMDNIGWLCAIGEEQDLGNTLSWIISLSDEEYRDLVYNQYCRLKDSYSIDGFVDVISNPEIGKQCLNTKDRFVYDVIRKIR